MNHIPEGLSRPTRQGTAGCTLARKLVVMERAVAAAFAVPEAELRARTRGSASVALARQTAMYLAHVAFGLSLTKVGQVFGRDRTTAAHACRRMEDRREDPRLDTLLVTLEQGCTPARCDRTRNGVRQ